MSAPQVTNRVISTDPASSTLRIETSGMSLSAGTNELGGQYLVIDWISYTPTTPGAASISIKLTWNNDATGTTLWKGATSTNSPTLFVSFPSGYPVMLSTIGTVNGIVYGSMIGGNPFDLAGLTPPAITIIGTAAGSCTVGYHYRRWNG
jgi:hypothetical protein